VQGENPFRDLGARPDSVIFRLGNGKDKPGNHCIARGFDRAVDQSQIRDKLAGRGSFWMGPSSVYHMWADDSDVPRRAIRELIDVFGKQGMIITPSPSVHSIMPWTNFLAMVDEWKRLR